MNRQLTRAAESFGPLSMIRTHTYMHTNRIIMTSLFETCVNLVRYMCMSKIFDRLAKLIVNRARGADLSVFYGTGSTVDRVLRATRHYYGTILRNTWASIRFCHSTTGTTLATVVLNIEE